MIAFGALVVFIFLTVVEIIFWRKLMSTSNDLVTTSKAVSDAAVALGAVATAVENFVQSNPGVQLVDQPTLDATVSELQNAAVAINSAAAALQALVPAAPAPTTTAGASSGSGA